MSSNNLFSNATLSEIKDIKHKYRGKKIGFCCSAFDILHAGHVLMLNDARKQADVLVVGLHTNPNLDRDSKNKPIQEYEEREIQIKGCRYVDEVIKYATEDDLLNILIYLNPDMRVLGTDWYCKEYTGHQLTIPIHWHQRNHNWSTTYLRERIYQAEKNKRSTTMITQDSPTHYTVRDV
jgi:glycerol-3-phosphate cytidylyltransferase